MMILLVMTDVDLERILAGLLPKCVMELDVLRDEYKRLRGEAEKLMVKTLRNIRSGTMHRRSLKGLARPSMDLWLSMASHGLTLISLELSLMVVVRV